MNKWRQALINPVLIKETKLRFRGMKSIWGIFFYLLVMGIVTIGMIFALSGGGTRPIRTDESRMLFIFLTVAQMGLILFMTPGLTSGVISSEREKQTLNILLTTEQSSTSIILSKLISSIAFLALMVLSSLPFYSLVFLFGGISPRELILTFVIFFVTMLSVGSLGVLFSTVFRKTIIATITTYGTALFLVAFLYAYILIFSSVIFGPTPTQHAIGPFLYFIVATNPAAVIISVFEPTFVGDILNHYGETYSILPTYVISYLVLTALALGVSIMILRPRYRRKTKG
ncbi:MAG: ABC transporter permease [Tuberibacillus sp.]